jgi:peptidoglycan/LPS O-acetylase OafA/YrhL
MTHRRRRNPVVCPGLETSQSGQKGPLLALTGARFFAAFAVVVYHYGSDAMEALVGPLAVCAKTGPVAVSFFYVLSGAVMTWGCTGPDGVPSRPNRLFWGQRAARLLPAYALALGLSVLPFAAAVMKLHPGSAGFVRIVSGFFANMLLLQAFIIPLAAGLNTPGWSISCEAFFYANWPRLTVALRPSGGSFPWRRAVLVWAVGLIAPLLAIVALDRGAVPAGPFATLLEDASGAELLVRTVSYFPPLRLPEFALGVVVGHALKQTPQSSSPARSIAMDTLRELGLVAALLACTWALGSGLPARVSRVPLATRICIESGTTAILFAVIVWQLARGAGLLRQFLSRPVLLVLGEASYALYVLQEPILVWLTAALKRLAPGAMVHWETTFWAYAVLLIVASVLVHKKWELPGRDLLLRLWTVRAGAGDGPTRAR